MIRKFLLPILLAAPLWMLAQENYCGTVQTDSDLAWLREWQASYNGSGTRGSDLIYVPLKVHIVGNDEGGGRLTLRTLYTDICNLNEQFAPTGFYFYIFGDIDYINNSDYYEHDWLAGAYMFAENNVTNLVNIYFVGDPAGNCGYFSPSGNAIAVANSCAGTSNTTIAHELGHFFSLPHTFYGWEFGLPDIDDQEQVDGDNCTTAADGFCDTPPDYLPERWSCFTLPVFTDPDGVEFSPDETLYMSYSSDECQNRFSEEQQEAMIDNINGPRAGLLTWEPISVADVESAELLSPEDNITNLFSNYTELSWSSVENALGYELIVSLTPTFTAISANIFTTDTTVILTELAPEKTYRWKVRVIVEGNTCEDYTEYRTFSTGAETLANDLTDLESDGWMVFPNPVAAGSGLMVKAENTWQSGDLLQVFNNGGQLIWQEQPGVGAQQHMIATNNWPTGMYLVRMTMDGLVSSSPVFVQ